jgi:octaprenyl-diphosphate synthase
MAFQIVDDILDMIGSERTLGKPVGGDFREGKVTLPAILALRRAGEQDRKLLEELLPVGAKLTDQDIDVARAVIERYDGFEAARGVAAGYVSAAKDALALLPSSAARDALAAVAELTVERDR